MGPPIDLDCSDVEWLNEYSPAPSDGMMFYIGGGIRTDDDYDFQGYLLQLRYYYDNLQMTLDE